MRAHIVVPEDLVKSVDELVGARRRSEFFAAAAAEKLTRARLAEAARAAAGSLADADIPEWETPERTRGWVRSSREAVAERLHDRRPVS